MSASKKKRAYVFAPKAPIESSDPAIEWLCSGEVATIFKITMRCLRYWRQKGVIVFYKWTHTRFVWYRKADVDAMILQGKRNGVAQ